MKNLICALATALLLLIANSGRADNGIPTSALNAMGLSGLTVMSDSEALQVRGLGAFATGRSWATFEGDDDSDWEAGSRNAYRARGEYAAAGANGSIAGRIRIRHREVENDGTESEVTTIRVTAVFAGGFSRATSF